MNFDQQWNAGRAERAEQFRNEERLRYDLPPMPTQIRGWQTIFGDALQTLQTPAPRQLAASVRRGVAGRGGEAPPARPPLTIAGWIARFCGCVLVFGLGTYIVGKKYALTRDAPARLASTGIKVDRE